MFLPLFMIDYMNGFRRNTFDVFLNLWQEIEMNVITSEIKMF